MPSSGRKVSRASVTKGASGTEKQQKATFFWCFQVNPSPAPRQLPLHKGAMSRCDFSLCAAEKTNAEFKFLNPKAAENRKSRTLPQALRASSLPEGACVCACFFSVPKGRFCGNSVPSKQSLSRSATAPFSQGSHGFVRFFPLCRKENKRRI